MFFSYKVFFFLITEKWLFFYVFAWFRENAREKLKVVYKKSLLQYLKFSFMK